MNTSRKKICSRGHAYAGSGPCPICWPGGRKRDSFSERVLELALSIPKGRVTTYGRLARKAGGGAMAAQSITAILWKAEQRGAKNIPYHRIVYADGRIWVNAGHRAERLALYKKEGIKLDENDKVVNFKKVVMP